MFSPANQTKSTLISGPIELTKSFIFEAAIHLAEEGHRVVYITQAPLESLPSAYHDRNNLSSDVFKLMRFMYLPTYETLVEQLADLHTFAVLPSVLLFDDLNAYICDSAAKEQSSLLELRIARLCAFIQDSTNACSRILKTPVHLCVAIPKCNITNTPYTIYFNNLWNLRVVETHGDSSLSLELYRHEDTDSEEAHARKVFSYRKFADGTLILKEIYEKFISHI